MSLSAGARRVAVPRLDHEWMRTATLAVPLVLVLAVVTIAVSLRPARSTELVLIAVVLGLFTLIVGHVRQILLVLVVFDISLQWDVNVGYQTAAAKYGAFAGLNISATTMALFLLYGMFLADRFAHLGTVRLRFAPARPLMVYIGVLILSVGVAHDRALSIYQIAMLVQTLLLFVYLASTVRTSADVRLIVGALIASLAVEGAVIIASFLNGGQLSLPGVNAESVAAETVGASDPRAGGTLGGPNSAGAFLSLVLAPTIAFALSPISRRAKLLTWIAFVIGALGLVFTFSRGAWIAFVLSMLILLFVGWRRGLFRARVPVALAMAVMILLLPVLPSITQRVSKSDSGSAESRVPLLKIAKRAIEANPFLGVGANNLAIRLPDYTIFEARNFLYVVHNRYLLIWAEGGAAALGAFLWFLVATLRRSARCSKGEDPMLSLVSIGIGAAVFGHMAHMMFDTFQSRPTTQLLWSLAGLLVAIEAMSGRSGASDR